ncbi:uncharacterized protein LOC117105530 [Anneissia japonica]|uniref:uncharacterized protein LOC117105530 n=1 Tax=Anneissia japonica TaxID=1529436 RepID=UPI001425A54F|nr:uncharacterized protein LOC117105530 [Anneissia japonica]
MAGVDLIQTQSSLEDGQSEVEVLQCIFSDEINVTSNRESKYSKEISIKPNNLGLAFCFSIPEMYPDCPPRIEVIPETFSLTDQQTGDLLQNMYQVAREMVGTPMILTIIEAAKDHLDKMEVNYTRPLDIEDNAKKNCKTPCSFFLKGKCRFGTKCLNLHPGHKEVNHENENDCMVNDEENKSKDRGQENDDNGESEKCVNGKKPPMKTACDVISRIQWDPELSPRHFIVGYLDRFLGILEQPFEAFSWVDIATVDLNTLAIPRHRIQYFKYQDEIVWDKRVRLDNVFGSTGSQTTITDVVKKFQKEGMSDEEKEVDEIDVELNAEDEENLEKSEDKPTKRKINRNVPNYFIAIRIDNEEILKNVKTVQDLILSNEPTLEPACTTLSSLHVTLCTLRLDSNDEKMTALKVLKDLQHEVSRLLPPSLLLRFEGLDNFHDRVLFSPPCPESALTNLIKRLQTKFSEAGISLTGTRDTPNTHMTILKLRRCNAESLGTPYLDKSYYSPFQHTYFGIQSVSDIHLCSMINGLRPDGFYDRLASVNLYDEYNVQ